ncbi:cytochrome P450 monooxygenase 4 [Glutinoglossum americanum]|uniref:Peptidyl-prolyl cis-trans isomerase n=1 Tax=Glutinoglossum americanum TaxID=1670608 RepID=A0A9P8KXB8_9PEZI|nr:cytochrome P450 monooxygenase 4 [Glutinoglossum americanum]
MSVTLHTDVGDLKIEIFCESVPKTAENFLALCASSYYNNTLFHRNIPGFMIQGGDPTGKGKGGTSIWGTVFDDEIRPALRHNARGIVSMANKGPGTNGSQFFIAYAAAGHLDGKNTVFGRVIEGADTTLVALEALEGDRKYRPKEPVHIKSVTIHANPLADQQ